MSTSTDSRSKIATIAACFCCGWFQDRNKIFKNKHSIRKPESHCPGCGHRALKVLVRYHYRHLKTLFGLVRYKKVIGFQSEEYNRFGM